MTKLNCTYDPHTDRLDVNLDASATRTVAVTDHLSVRYDEERLAGYTIEQFTLYTDYLALRDAVGPAAFNLTVHLQAVWAGDPQRRREHTFACVGDATVQSLIEQLGASVDEA